MVRNIALLTHFLRQRFFFLVPSSIGVRRHSSLVHLYGRDYDNGGPRLSFRFVIIIIAYLYLYFSLSRSWRCSFVLRFLWFSLPFRYLSRGRSCARCYTRRGSCDFLIRSRSRILRARFCLARFFFFLTHSIIIILLPYVFTCNIIRTYPYLLSALR